MEAEQFIRVLAADFYTGVPDSLLRPLCDYLYSAYGISGKKHIVAANEGNAVAIAAGFNMVTGKIPVVYMQNSGEGNIVNPVASLLSDKVYAIPLIFVIGWRGEPGVKDEPQHIFQGEITLKLLDTLNIAYFVVDKNTAVSDVTAAMENFQTLLSSGRSVAFVLKKGALTASDSVKHTNDNIILREEAIRHIVDIAKDDTIVATTGKAGRELYEIRETLGQGHKHDFLTVGSMGHSSSIALGIALQQPSRKVWCIDGDGAMLMHMGAMAVIGTHRPGNMIHIVINNEAHESVGGMPTVAGNIDVTMLARACGYERVASVADLASLDAVLQDIKVKNELVLIEVKCALGARSDLGRPKELPVENKVAFMEQFD